MKHTGVLFALVLACCSTGLFALTLDPSYFSKTEVCTPNKREYKFYPIKGRQFNFQVRALGDATIALVGKNDTLAPIYEIVIGGSKNTNSAIFRDSELVVSTPTVNILDPCECRGFWIRWSTDNVISAGKQRSTTPIVSYKADNLYDVQLIGIRTDNGSSGDWTFDRKQ